MSAQVFSVLLFFGWLAVGAIFVSRAAGADETVRAAWRRSRPGARLAAVAALAAAVAVGGSKGTNGTLGGRVAGVGECAESSGIAMLEAVRAPFSDAAVVSNLCFSAISVSTNEVLLSVQWPEGLALPDGVLDLFMASSLSGPWALSESFAATGASASVFVVATNASAFFRLGTRLDSDGDGLTDAFEGLVSGTDAADPDTDADGLADGEELAIGTNPLHADSDGDGFTDLEEILAGTDPLVPGLPPQEAAIRHFHDADGRLAATFPGPSPAMSSTSWTPSGNPRATWTGH